MRSERQRQASRLNGAKSKGPVTAAGKAHSSRNSLKQGWCSQELLRAFEAWMQPPVIPDREKMLFFSNEPGNILKTNT